MNASIPDSTLEQFSTFGDFLRFLRRREGITQLELSIAVGYSDAQISRLEQNLRLPDIPTLQARLIPALGLEDEPRAAARLLDLAANVRREDAPALGLCPYKGMAYFDEADADLFVGREALTNELAQKVLAMSRLDDPTPARFLAVIGASGSGKSSLLRAGLAPALRWQSAAANWPVYLLTPGAHPLENLALALTRDGVSAAAAAGLVDDLQSEVRSLDLFLKRQSAASGASHVLLLVDQFEEIFTLCRGEQERTAFIDNLMTAVSGQGPTLLVIALRADFYGHCADYPALRTALSHQQVYIGAMSEPELRRAIEEPARRNRWEFEDGLVDMLLHDVGSEPGALPLLSHALLETWQRRRGRMLTFSGYASSGGVRGAIAETAESVFSDRLSQPQRVIARRIFLRLTELGDETNSGDTRRRACLAELIPNPDQAEATHTVLRALADARLITLGEDTVEVAHEALIREWPTLRSWLEQNRQDLYLHQNLSDAAQEWQSAARESDLLYRGLRLAQARVWALTHQEDMNPQEQEFLAASIDLNDCEAAEREAQRQRELEVAQKLAESESRRAAEQSVAASRLQKRALFLALALLVALAMSVMALFFGSQARQAAQLAQAEGRVATARELSAAAFNNLDKDAERSILLALQAVAATYDVDQTWTAEAENSLRQALQASRIVHTLPGHNGRVGAVAFSPVCPENQAGDADDAASTKCARRLASAGEDGAVILWDAQSGEKLHSLESGAFRQYQGLAFSPDGALLVTSGAQGTARVWDLSSGKPRFDLKGHSDWVTAIAYSPDGKWIATAGEDRSAVLWRADNGQEERVFSGHTQTINALAFSPDGSRLVSAGEDGFIFIWDTLSGEKLISIGEQSAPVRSVGFSPDGMRLASAGGDVSARVWDAGDGSLVLTLIGHSADINQVVFSPDGTRLATASADGAAILWDSATGGKLFTLSGQPASLTGIAFSQDCHRQVQSLDAPCGSLLATAGVDGAVKIWNGATPGETLVLQAPEASTISIAASGKHLAVGYDGGALKVFELAGQQRAGTPAGKELLNLVGTQGSVDGIVFSPDGTRLAASSADAAVRIWSLPMGDLELTLRGHTGHVYPLVFSPDGTRLATTGADRTVRVWDAASGQELLIIPLSSWSYNLGFSPDGTMLAAAVNDGVIRIWDAKSGKEIHALRGHNGEVWCIAFSPDGKKLASGGNDGTTIVWDILSGAQLLSLHGHAGSVDAIAFSPDGALLATAGQDSILKLWNATSGVEIQAFNGHKSAVVQVSFSADGRNLLSIGQDRSLHGHLLYIEDLVALANTRTTRTLTSQECRQYLHKPAENCEQEFPQTDTAADVQRSVTARPRPSAGGKVCQMTDNSGMADQFYNQLAYQGVLAAAEKYGWQSRLVEPRHVSDYAKEIENLAFEGCNLIVTPTGAFFNDVIRTAALAHPQVKFQLMDWVYDDSLANVWQETYAVDQASFLAGYAAAALSKTGKVGVYGGIAIPQVTIFMDGFALGVRYYNKIHRAEVELIGWDVDTRQGLFSGGFQNTQDGRKMGEELLEQGVDIILPVAGLVGLGTAELLKEQGEGFVIGVDSDWSTTFPEYAGVILTSIQKRLDNSVMLAVQDIATGVFLGDVHTAGLENGGVSLSPIYNQGGTTFENLLVELEQIKSKIIDGEIQTRP